MGHRTRIFARFDTVEDATAIRRSLAPEADALVDERSRTRISQTDAMLTIRIRAGDLVALRAALNTWYGLLTVAERVGTTEPDAT